ncbi:cell division protein FtsQ [Mobilitalea sibirica]|uniref:Cell division protein FtsQ n=1 Tax=Mobilitalea sibirica TaxID=1462919 RepID=A0A8J7H333_9FIRM|nr:cell division protein FtsQ/DivIB [Mobilitalea sibirica]MBH1941368.1 cell division protein FtsQ [Mobilitalea sibirica]
MNRKMQRNSNSVRKRLLLKSIKAFIFIGLPIILFGFTFQLKNLTIQGSSRNTPEQVKEQIIKTKLDSNALLLYLKYTFFTDVQIPFVEKVDMELLSNNTIKVRVYEKMVTGCVEFMGEYLYFDKDGYVVESSSKRLEDIPQIIGLKFNKIILHEKLEVQKEDLFDVILNLTQLIEKYQLEVDTISFNNRYEITLQCGDIKALIGKRSTYDEIIAELSGILKEAQGMKLDKLDLRNFKDGKGTIIAIPENPTD